MAFKKLFQFTVRSRWFIPAVWVILAGLLLWKAPVLSHVAKSDQQSLLPSDTDAIKYGNTIKELFPGETGGSLVILTMHRKGGLSDADRKYGARIEAYLNSEKASYTIKSIRSPFTDKNLESSMMSKDGEAAFMNIQLGIPSYNDATNDVVHAIRKLAGVSADGGPKDAGAPPLPAGLTVNVTGDSAFGQEEMDNIRDSMSLTSRITVFLVIFILVVIYRSPLAPLLPLCTIGISFLVSRGLIASLTSAGLRVSSFTETFLIAVLFGAGTDYCLLLVSRYREEIASGKSSRDALAAAYPHTGKAIVSSGGTVIIGFLAMVSARFGLFNTTGPSIAIGVAITIMAVLTLTPAIIAILGEKIFWPLRPSLHGKNGAGGRNGSRFWERLSAAVTARPARFILVTLVVLTPFMLSAAGLNRSFDQLKELPAKSDALQGFDVIRSHFNQGEMLPVKVVLKTGRDIMTGGSLQAVDGIARCILKVDGVAKVLTATRPLGTIINEASIPGQMEMLKNGLDSVYEGLDPILDGFRKMQGSALSMAGGISGAGSGLNVLADSTAQAANAVGQVGSGLDKASAGEQSVIDGLAAVGSGMGRMPEGAAVSKDSVDKADAALKDALGKLKSVLGQQPSLAKNTEFQTAYATIEAVISKMPAIGSGLGSIGSGAANAQKAVDSAVSGLAGVKNGIDRSREALDKVLAGLKTMDEKQRKAGSDLKLAANGLSQLSGNIGKGREGLEKVKSGISDTRDAAGGYASGSGSGLGGVFYLPEGTLDKYPQLRDAMEYYIAPGGKGVVINVILSLPPYRSEALDSISSIREAVRFGLKGTPLAGAEFHIGGTTAAYSELRDITADDFKKLMIFVLSGIFIVLVILLRSIIAPLYLIFTIIVSFASTMGISRLVFQNLRGDEGLSWAVPFFSFCILVALGVDYNIFLMTRVKEEYRPGGTTGGIARALITSCGIIMAGTFGAMVLSPVNQLVEIGFTTVTGLLLDTFIIRCLTVPAIAVKFGELNWWPGRRVKVIPYVNGQDNNLPDTDVGSRNR